MNDDSIIEETAAQSAITIRVAEPADAGSLDRLAELDERRPGPAPHLVADDGGHVVAAVSLTDGTTMSDPFRRTQHVASLLRVRARQLDGLAGARGPGRRRSARRAVRSILLGAACALALAATAGATPRPGLPAGTWVGKATVSGVGTEGGFPSTFSGGMAFRLVVAADGKVSGTGTWTRKMVNTKPMPAVVSSKASVTFSGSAASITYRGTAKTVMAIRSDGVTRTLTWKPLNITQPLPITRAGSCRAEGSSTVKGVTFRWTATLQQSSGTTCLS